MQKMNNFENEFLANGGKNYESIISKWKST